jgi:hypothetical protein
MLMIQEPTPGDQFGCPPPLYFTARSLRLSAAHSSTSAQTHPEVDLAGRESMRGTEAILTS